MCLPQRSFVAVVSFLSASCGYIDNPRLADSETASTQDSTDVSDSTSDEGQPPTTDGATQTTDGSGGTSPSDTEEGCTPGALGCACVNESCDDGLTCADGICAEPVCGNGRLEPTEACDDGNLEGADGCDSDCTPTRIDGLTAGYHHTCVHTTAQEVLCFGRNDYGQLGYGHETDLGDNESPGAFGAVPLPQPATAVVAGGSHTCALLMSGAALCWGYNGGGHLGQGTTEELSGIHGIPTDLTPIDLDVPIDQIAAGGSFTCVKTVQSDVHCWGQGSSGQLGQGEVVSIGDNELPTAANTLVTLAPAVSIGAGVTHACAALTRGGLQCWGNGGNGKLGYGNTEQIGDDELPITLPPVQPGITFSQLALGDSHTLALDSETGQLLGVGNSTQGQLGTGVATSYGDGVGPSLATPSLESDIVQIIAGSSHSCALLEDGRVSCFGSGGSGQLGYGSSASVGDNESVTTLEPLSFDSPAVQLAAGTAHSCALLEDGQLFCWGDNSYGQIGHEGVAGIGILERADEAEPVNLFD